MTSILGRLANSFSWKKKLPDNKRITQIWDAISNGEVKSIDRKGNLTTAKLIHNGIEYKITKTITEKTEAQMKKEELLGEYAYSVEAKPQDYLTIEWCDENSDKYNFKFNLYKPTSKLITSFVKKLESLRPSTTF